MEIIDHDTLARLILGYKHLWLKYQELRYSAKHPQEENPDIVRDAVFDEVYDLFQPALDALSEQRQLQEPLRELVDAIERTKELPFAG